nr:PREDICTED: bidirectional sugar transporter SWEET16 isoform X3 [Musa acuminata subsp. malaccensis]
MEASLLFVGIVGNVISVLVFASPINTFRRIVRNRSTEDFEPSPYVITLLNSSLWVYYGITKPGGLLIVTVNGVGVVMEAVYVALFLLYAAPPLKAKTAVLVAALDVGFFGAVALVTRLAVHGSSRVVVIGFVCAFLNVLMYGSPLCAMIPNGIGLILGTSQLIMYMIYMNSEASNLSGESYQESQQQRLIVASNEANIP